MSKKRVNTTKTDDFIAKSRDFIKENKKKIILFASGFFAFIILVITLAVIFEVSAKNDLVAYENIMEEYSKVYQIKNAAKKKKEFAAVALKLEKLTDSSISGYVNEFGYYVIAGLYMTEKDYKNAKKFYLKFADSSSSDLTYLALRQAAICDEWNNNFDSALEIYLEIEDDYSDEGFNDQILYDLGRMYQKKKDIIKAREYFNKIVKTYPRSVYVNIAKKRLVALNYK